MSAGDDPGRPQVLREVVVPIPARGEFRAHRAEAPRLAVAFSDGLRVLPGPARVEQGVATHTQRAGEPRGLQAFREEPTKRRGRHEVAARIVCVTPSAPVQQTKWSPEQISEHGESSSDACKAS
jgi:hypothetical protein